MNTVIENLEAEISECVNEGRILQNRLDQAIAAINAGNSDVMAPSRIIAQMKYVNGRMNGLEFAIREIKRAQVAA